MNVWTGAVLSIVLALAGMGAMALAVGRVAGSLISGAMFLAASPLPYRFGLNRTHVAPLLRFGLPLAGTSIIFFAVGYADQLTAGAVLGSAALGFYVLAFNLSNWPVSILAQPLRRVAPAAFSALQQDKQAMNSALVSVVAVLAAVTLPPVMFLAGSAVPLVDLVYGKEWLPAAAALSWLVVGAVSRIFSDLAYDFMVVQGRSGTVFFIQAGSLVVLVPALAAGAAFSGLQGLAMAQAACLKLRAPAPVPLATCQNRRVGGGHLFSGMGPRSCFHCRRCVVAWSWSAGCRRLGWSFQRGLPLPPALPRALLYWRRNDLKLLRGVGREAPSEVAELVP